MKYYKLTDQNMTTFAGTKWGENVTHTAKGKGKELCSKDCIHVYDSPYKAAFFNPIHANFEKPILWECLVDEVVQDDGIKIGVKTCTTLKQIPLPEISLAARIRVGILLAIPLKTTPKFRAWAKKWLDSPSTRSYSGAYEGADIADAATDAATVASVSAARYDFDKLLKEAIAAEQK